MPPLRFTHIFLLALSMALVACGQDSPPEGYRPAKTATGDATRACPDLAGVYAPASTAWLDDFITEKRPEVAGALTAVVSKGPTHVQLQWQGNRAAFFAHARDFALSHPLAYPQWRSLVLRQSLPESLRRDEDAYHEAVNRLGPSFDRTVMLPSRQCAEHWMLVGHRDVHPPKDADQDGKANAKHEELWLSRSEAGELLLRRVTYDLKHYSIWAASTSSFHTNAKAQYDKWPAAQGAAAEPLRDEELPRVAAAATRDTCRFTDERLGALARRLKSKLPAGAVLESITSGHTAGQPGVDGKCPRVPLTLIYSSHSAADAAAVRAALQADSAISYVEPPRPAQFHPGKYVVMLTAWPE